MLPPKKDLSEGQQPPKYNLKKRPSNEQLLRGKKSSLTSLTGKPLPGQYKPPLKMGETILQRRRGNSQNGEQGGPVLNTGTKNNFVPIKKLVDKEAQKQFENDFTQVLLELRSFQEDKKVAEQQDDAIKQLCGRINVLVLDWANQPSVTQKMCARESLLQGLIFILKEIENPKVRIRSIKQAINILKSIGFSYIFSDKQSQDVLLPPDALYELLIAVLRQALKLTKTQENEKILIEENMTTSYIELLQSLHDGLNPKKFDLKAIDLLTTIYTIMKNETSSNEHIRKKYFFPSNLILVTGFLHYFDFSEQKEPKQVTEKIFQLYIAVTAVIRNLAIDVNCTVSYYKHRVIEKLTKSIQHYPHVNDLMLNTMRILSKLSLNRECSLQMFENQFFIKNILGFYRLYKDNLFIIIRVSFILANLTAFIKDIRNFIYFEQKGFEDIFNCFIYYAEKEIAPKEKVDETEKMNITNTGWDFKQLQKEKDIDALIKMVRLIANLLTIPTIGEDVILNNNKAYKTIIKVLLTLCQKKDLDSSQELISCCLSCIANITYYEKNPISGIDFAFKNTKVELIVATGGYIMQTQNEDICCEGLRVLSNLSRHKELLKNIIKYKIIEALIVLLDSNSKEIVYYSIGVLINLMKFDEVKNLYIDSVIEQILAVLEDCTLEEFDLLDLGFKCLGNLLGVNSQLDQKYIKRIESILEQTGEQCDSLIEQSQDLDKTSEISQIFDLRGIINQLHNNMPEESYQCAVPNCGRKFKNKEDLENHVKRRHKI